MYSILKISFFKIHLNTCKNKYRILLCKVNDFVHSDWCPIHHEAIICLRYGTNYSTLANVDGCFDQHTARDVTTGISTDGHSLYRARNHVSAHKLRVPWIYFLFIDF